MESSGRAVSKTVPGFEFRATFEGDIEGFRPVKVLVATTVFLNVPYECVNELEIFIQCMYDSILVYCIFLTFSFVSVNELEI